MPLPPWHETTPAARGAQTTASSTESTASTYWPNTGVLASQVDRGEGAKTGFSPFLLTSFCQHHIPKDITMLPHHGTDVSAMIKTAK